MERMHILEKAKEMAWRELEELVQNGDSSERAMERMKTLVKVIKNSGEAAMLELADDTSERRYSRGWGGTYQVRGRYGRDHSYGKGSDDPHGGMVECVRDLMERERDPRKKEEARRFLERLENR